MLETAVMVIAGAANLLLCGSAFLLWQAIQSIKDSIQAESDARMAAEARLQGEITKIESQINANSSHASETYMRRDDHRADMVELKALIRQILDKIDWKADK